jgi:hypothetical protein
MGNTRNANMILVSKSERKKPLGRYRHSRDYNTKINLRRIGYGEVNRNQVAHLMSICHCL